MRSSFFKNPSGEFLEGRCIRIDIAQKVGGYSAMVQGATIEFLDYIKSSVLHPAFELKSCSRMKHEEARVRRKQRTRWKDVVKTVVGPHGPLPTGHVDTDGVLLLIA
jgi:hypothetical protein